MSPVRVLLVDDEELIRAGLRGILRPRYGLRMPRVDGVTATAQLRAVPDAPPVLGLTTSEDDDVLAGALRAGAAGFLLKGVPADDLQRAVRTVAEAGPGSIRQ